MAAASLVGLGSIADLIRDHRRCPPPMSISYPKSSVINSIRVAQPSASSCMEISAPCRRPTPGAAPRAAGQTAPPQAPRSSRAPQHFLVGSTVGRGRGRVVNEEATRDPRPSRGISRGRGTRRRDHPTSANPQAQSSLNTLRPVTGCAGHIQRCAAPSASIRHTTTGAVESSFVS